MSVQMHRIVYQIIINSMYTNNPLLTQHMPSFVNPPFPSQYPQFAPIPNQSYQTPFRPEFGVCNHPQNHQVMPMIQTAFNTPIQFSQFQYQSPIGFQSQTPATLQPQLPLGAQQYMPPQTACISMPARDTVSINDQENPEAKIERTCPQRKREKSKKMIDILENIEQDSCQFEKKQEVPVSKEKFNNQYFKIIKEMQQNAKNSPKRKDDISMNAPHPRIAPDASVNEMRYFWEQKYYELQVNMEYTAYCIETAFNLHNEFNHDAYNAYLAQAIVDQNFAEGSRSINRYLKKIHKQFSQSIKVHDEVFKQISPQTMEYFNSLSVKKFSIGCLEQGEISVVNMASSKEIQIPAVFIEGQKKLDQYNQLRYFKNKYNAALEEITEIKEQLKFYKEQHKKHKIKIIDMANSKNELTNKVKNLTQQCQNLKQNANNSNVHNGQPPQFYEDQTEELLRQIYLTMKSVNQNCGYMSNKICRLQEIQAKSQINYAELIKREDEKKLCSQCSKALDQKKEKKQDSLFEEQTNEQFLQMCRKHNAYKQKVESSLKDAKETIKQLNPLIGNLEIDSEVGYKISSLITECSNKIDLLL